MATLKDCLSRQADAIGDRTAVAHAEVRLTFSQLRALAERVGHILDAAGIKPDAPLYLAAEDGNWCTYLSGFLGLAISGRVPVLAPFGSSPMGGLDRMVLQIRGGFRMTIERGQGPVEKCLTNRFPNPLDVVFSSGSTGQPKGYLFDESHFIRMPDLRYPKYELRAAHFGIPFFTSTGAHGIALRHLLAGITSIHLDSASSWIKLSGMIEEIAPFELSSTPFALAPICNDLADSENIKTPRQLRVYAGPLSDALIRKLQLRFRGSRIVSIYGATEAGSTTLTRSGIGSKFNLAEKPDVARLWNPEQARWAEKGEVGEILMATGTVVGPPLRVPETSTLVPYPAGWIAAGDLGRLERDNTLTFLGRSNDIIVVEGERSSALIVEQSLDAAGLPGTIVFTLASPGGEALCALLEWEGGSDLPDLRELLSIAAFSCVIVVSNFPRNALGKFIRAAAIAGAVNDLDRRGMCAVKRSMDLTVYDLRDRK